MATTSRTAVCKSSLRIHRSNSVDCCSSYSARSRRQRICSIDSLLRDCSRSSSTRGSLGRMKIETERGEGYCSRTCRAPSTSISSSTCLPDCSTFSTSALGVPYSCPPYSAYSRNCPAPTRSQFLEGVGAGQYLEYAEYGGQLYGTPKAEVEKVLQSGKHVLLDIEVEGARQVREQYQIGRAN